MIDSLQRRLYEVLEGGDPRDRMKRLVEWPLIVLIIANVFVVVVETVETVYARYQYELLIFEYVSVAIFTLEFTARLWVCTAHGPHARSGPLRGRLRFAATPFAVIDFLAILPFYLSFLLPGIDLRMLRIFRLLRLLKLARYSPALATLGKVLQEERRALLAALFIMIGLLMLSSTAMYHVERHVQPDVFTSIPAAMWWSLATLTTVGYGDVVPITPIGRLLGGVVMIFGLAMFALPVGIVASGFASEIHRRDFVVSWGMVAQVPLFAELDAVLISRISNLLRSSLVAPDTVVFRKGDASDAMYFIVSGAVEVDVKPEAIHLHDGDFFGEVGLVRKRARMATVRTVTQCRFLVLDFGDFHDLIESDRDLREAVTAAVDARAVS